MAASRSVDISVESGRGLLPGLDGRCAGFARCVPASRRHGRPLRPLRVPMTFSSGIGSGRLASTRSSELRRRSSGPAFWTVFARAHRTLTVPLYPSTSCHSMVLKEAGAVLTESEKPLGYAATVVTILGVAAVIVYLLTLIGIEDAEAVAFGFLSALLGLAVFYLAVSLRRGSEECRDTRGRTEGEGLASGRGSAIGSSSCRRPASGCRRKESAGSRPVGSKHPHRYVNR